MNREMKGNGNIPANMRVDERKKILIITDVFRRIAGSERNIMHLLTGSDQTRFQLNVACIKSGELAKDMRVRGFRIYDLNRGGIYTIGGLKNIIFLYRLVRREKIDLIVTYHEGSDFLGLVLSNACDIPIICNRRDMGFKTRFHHRAAYRIVGRYFDGVVAVSEAVKDEVIGKGWFKKERIYTLHNGVNVGKYDDSINAGWIKRSIGIEGNKHIVGLIGNFRKIKGIRYFIEAASLVCRNDSEIEFVVVGEDLHEPGSTINDMKLLAERLKIADKFHFLGRRTDVAELISIFDVAVVASLSEGFSNVILEYMASAKPVVASDVGGNREAVEHGETGLLVPSGNAQALAGAIRFILENREIALKYGLAGRKRAEERFSLKEMIRKYECLFEKYSLNN